MKRHCDVMLQTAKDLGVGFRAHVKTHKTTEGVRLQMGDSQEVNLVASTVLEIENLVPLLREYRDAGRSINILYGVPLGPSQVDRLGRIATILGPDSVSVMIDDPQQLASLTKFKEIAGFPACIFLKVDTGYHRAGLPAQAMNKKGMLASLVAAEKAGHAKLKGVYSHNSLSYAGTTPEQAMTKLREEIQGCLDAVKYNEGSLPDRKLVVSIGATPQVVSAQNLTKDHSSAASEAARKILREPGANVTIELHAGVYPVLDMQQMATHARLSSRPPAEDIALTVVAEVCSVYSERSKPEAMISAGCLALGREPSPDYRGWGVVSAWGRQDSSTKSRLIVDRISQEHGVLALEEQDPDTKTLPLTVGQKIKIWPNHACITGAGYGWYLVVDSSKDDPTSSKIVDVWVRWTGW
ncbi:putative alanine racemase domain protein [Phaeomoniella chlamydospora]|uniref:D-serine dehydratase n=1 Tax=Phaeomoniella chlamydospora TaxID=158046 RepID=A0A0G2GPV0_PHACM|nr:putative alanine racemase domain protein [Phaeomoniella chlamydospora]